MAIGLLGGTFDPVHNAHIQMALEAKQTLNLDEVKLIPCHRPPHRGQPSLSSEQRLQLLNMALAEVPGLVADDRELQRDTASYTIDTLLSFRQELGDQASLVFLMGMDAFAALTSWHQWQRLRELAHIAVISRPDSPPPTDSELSAWLAAPDDYGMLHQQPHGACVWLQQSLLPISATAIRQQWQQGETIENVPRCVAQYLEQHPLTNDE